MSKKLKYFELKKYHNNFSDKHKFMVFVTPKGIGKTYSAIKMCLELWENEDKAFAYCFRYSTEIDMFKNEINSYLDFERYEVKNNKFCVYIWDKFKQEIAGILQAVSLSKYSKNYEKVKIIVFDEFISADNRYLSEEYRKFYLLISNLCRSKTDTNIYMLGNYHSQFNPYFAKWKIWNFERTEYGLVDDKILIVLIVESDYKQVLNAQTTQHILEKYDSDLSGAYRQGKFIFDNDNMIQTGTIKIHDWKYCVSLDGKYIYIGKIDNRLYFTSEKQKTTITYALTLSDGLINNENKIVGKQLGEYWKYKIIKRNAIFSSYEVRDDIIKYIALINDRFEL